MNSFIQNQKGRLPFKMVILSLAIILVLTTSGILLIQKSNNNETMKQWSNEVLDIRIPIKYTQPLVIAAFNNVLQIKPINAKSSNKIVETRRGTSGEYEVIKYIDAYPSTDVEQIKYPNKLKESLILKSPNHPNRFEYKINIDDFLWEINSDGDIIFRDKNKRDFSCIKSDNDSCVPEAVARNLLDEHQEVFRIPAPFLIEQRYEGQEWKMHVEKGDVKVEIKKDRLILIPDKEWLQSHEYPIVLDPTVEQIPEPSLEIDEDGFIPMEIKKWQNADQSTQFKKRIGGAIANYEKENGSWSKIDNKWIQENNDLFVNNTDMLKTQVSKDGETRIDLTWENETYTVSQKLEKLVWLDTQTEELIDIYNNVNWQTPAIQDNKIDWTDIWPGIDYAVEKNDGQVPHYIYFKPEFLKTAVNQYDQMPEQENIALGNMMVYELTNVDRANEPIGDVQERIFKDLGAGHTFKLFKQYLHFPEEEEQKQIPIMQKWIKKDNKIYCIEYVLMDEIKKIHQEQPEAMIWHNDSTQIDGTTDVEDAQIASAGADVNLGGRATTITLTATANRGLFRVKNVASNLGEGATITACTLSLYYTSAGNTVSVYRVFKPWGEGDNNGTTADAGECSWNDWSATTNEWTTAGCGSADDGGSDNSGDGTGADRKSTAEDTQNPTSTSTYHNWTITNALAQGWYDTTINEEGVLAIESVDAYSLLTPTESASNQPYWTFTYDVVSNATPSVTSVSDSPDLVPAGNVITFSVDWADDDAGENIKAKICKTDSLTSQVCDGGHWATSSAFTTSDPEAPTYTTATGDIGSQNYWAYVCDDEAACVASGSGTSGSFVVDKPSTVPDVKFR